MSRAITIVLLVVSTAAPALAGASKDFTHAWSRRFGGEQIELLRDVCVDGAGNVIVCGHHAGDIDFGGGTLSCAGGDDAFLAKFDVDGNHIWSRSFGDSSDQQGIAVGVDAAGNIYLTGWFRSIVDFGGGPLTGPGNEDTFLAKFDGLGNHLWSIARGGTGSDRPNDLVVDSWGNVVITGWFYGPVADFCGGLGCAGGQDIYLVKYNPYGTCLYAFSWGDASNQQGLAVAVDMNDDILLAGEFYGTVDFGSGPLTSAGQADVFLAKFYGDTGQIYFAYSYGDADHDAVAAVAADLDYIYLGGSTVASIDFGGGALDGGAGWDVYVACLDAYGAHYWSRIFPDADGSFMMDLILTDTHCPAITGYYGDRIDFGGGELVSAGQEDIFVAVLDPGDGGHVESASFGGTGLDYGDALASAPGDYLVLGGYTDGTIDLGGGPLANAGYYDVLLARYLLGPPGFPPEVVVSIPDLLVQETAPPVDNHVCLTDVFWDPEEGSALAYEVVGWTNLDLLTATVDADSCLDISFNELMDGAAVVTVRATDSVGRSIEDAFEVTVEPLPDAPLIQGIADVPNDQGRTVRITLRRSGQDDLGATTPILQYEAWRRLDPLPPAAAGRPVPPVR
ncbi:hypothetical protein KKG45_11780, partial [bacterium]|nr:hypothetical protein [bacterium]